LKHPKEFKENQKGFHYARSLKKAVEQEEKLVETLKEKIEESKARKKHYQQLLKKAGVHETR
jgi:protein associated with RNAse G/E